MTILIPFFRTRSPLNGSHQHWAVKAKRAREERELVYWHLRSQTPPALPCAVTLVRIAPRPFDTDNLAASFKGTRDQVAVWLGLPTNKRGHADDRDPRVTWRYDWEKGQPKEYGVRVEVEPRVEAA